MKAVVAAFNQEKALVGAFSVITNLRMALFQAPVNIVARSRSLVYLLFVAVAKVNEQFLVAHQLYCWIQFDAVAFCTNGLHKVTLNGYLLRGYPAAECSCCCQNKLSSTLL